MLGFSMANLGKMSVFFAAFAIFTSCCAESMRICSTAVTKRRGFCTVCSSASLSIFEIERSLILKARSWLLYIAVVDFFHDERLHLRISFLDYPACRWFCWLCRSLRGLKGQGCSAFSVKSYVDASEYNVVFEFLSRMARLGKMANKVWYELRDSSGFYFLCRKLEVQNPCWSEVNIFTQLVYYGSVILVNRRACVVQQ